MYGRWTWNRKNQHDKKVAEAWHGQGNRAGRAREVCLRKRGAPAMTKECQAEYAEGRARSKNHIGG